MSANGGLSPEQVATVGEVVRNFVALGLRVAIAYAIIHFGVGHPYEWIVAVIVYYGRSQVSALHRVAFLVKHPEKG